MTSIDEPPRIPVPIVCFQWRLESASGLSAGVGFGCGRCGVCFSLLVGKRQFITFLGLMRRVRIVAWVLFFIHLIPWVYLCYVVQQSVRDSDGDSILPFLNITIVSFS